MCLVYYLLYAPAGFSKDNRSLPSPHVLQQGDGPQHIRHSGGLSDGNFRSPIKRAMRETKMEDVRLAKTYFKLLL